MIIDGIPITDEERGKAELYFMDQQVQIHVIFLCCYIEMQQFKNLLFVNLQTKILQNQIWMMITLNLFTVIFWKHFSFYSIYVYRYTSPFLLAKTEMYMLRCSCLMLSSTLYENRWKCCFAC